MKIIALRLFIFLFSALFFAFVSWLGGYNFDERGMDKAAFFVAFAIFCFLLASLPKSMLDTEGKS